MIIELTMSQPSASQDTSRLHTINRRQFFKAAGSAALLPAVLPAFGAQSSGVSANNRINLGVIGMGWQGPGNTQSFLPLEDCQVVAACDIDASHLRAAVKMVNDAYGE